MVRMEGDFRAVFLGWWAVAGTGIWQIPSVNLWILVFNLLRGPSILGQILFVVCAKISHNF